MTTPAPKAANTCAYPLCGEAWLDDKVQLCIKHREMVDFLTWSLDHLTLRTGNTIGQALIDITTIGAAVADLIKREQARGGLVVPKPRIVIPD